MTVDIGNNNSSLAVTDCGGGHRRFPTKIFILYASQTGQAESISEFIYDQFVIGQLSPIRSRLGSDSIQRHCLSSYEKLLEDGFFKDLNSISVDAGGDVAVDPPFYLAIFVVSTTGQGDSPDKAIKFFRWIRRLKREVKPGNPRARTNLSSSRNRTKASETATSKLSTSTQTRLPLGHLQYALLGLGDTNYDNFANFGHLLDQLLLDLGAKPYIPTAYADDAVGLELVTEPFIQTLTDSILGHYRTIYPDCSTMLSEQENLKKMELNFAQLKLKSKKDDDESKEDSSSTSPVTAAAAASVKFLDKRTIVSSCEEITNDDREELEKFAKSLTEPSESFRHLSDDQLKFPPSFLASLTGPKKNSPENEAATITVEQKNIQDYLQEKIPTQQPLYKALAVMERHLRPEASEFKREKHCIHRAKTVIHSEIRYFSKVEEEPEFIPGDSLGIYSSNSLVDVHQILVSCTTKQEKLNSPGKVDRSPAELLTLWEYFFLNSYKRLFHTVPSARKNVKYNIELIPYLVYGADLRAIPKKAAIWFLAQHTSDPSQRRRLLELCSLDGNLDYQKVVLHPRTSFCDLLRMFDQCHPPIDLLLGHIPVAKPRYFSGASIPERILPRNSTSESTSSENNADLESVDDDELLLKLIPYKLPITSIRIIFSILNNFSGTLKRTSENLFGLFSGKLYQHYKFGSIANRSCNNAWNLLQQIASSVTSGDISLHHDQVSLCQPIDSTPFHFPIYIFARKNQSFRLSLEDFSRPLILISTGTGIAPFMSYLQFREKAIKEQKLRPFGQVYFLHGCRHPQKDLILAEQLIRYASDSSTDVPQVPVISHLCFCFSRCESAEKVLFELTHSVTLCKETLVDIDSEYRHVNHLVAHHGSELVDLIVNQSALVYICGDWRKIGTKLTGTFETILDRHHFKNDSQSQEEKSSPLAVQYMKDLQKQGRFQQDIWS